MKIIHTISWSHLGSECRCSFSAGNTLSCELVWPFLPALNSVISAAFPALSWNLKSFLGKVTSSKDILSWPQVLYYWGPSSWPPHPAHSVTVTAEAWHINCFFISIFNNFFFELVVLTVWYNKSGRIFCLESFLCLSNLLFCIQSWYSHVSSDFSDFGNVQIWFTVPLCPWPVSAPAIWEKFLKPSFQIQRDAEELFSNRNPSGCHLNVVWFYAGDLLFSTWY